MEAVRDEGERADRITWRGYFQLRSWPRSIDELRTDNELGEEEEDVNYEQQYYAC